MLILKTQDPITTRKFALYIGYLNVDGNNLYQKNSMKVEIVIIFIDCVLLE